MIAVSIPYLHERMAAHLGAAMRRARKERDISSAEMARRMETSPGSVRRIEEGRHCPSLEFVYRYAAAVGIDPVWDLLYVVDDVIDVQIGALKTRCRFPLLVTEEDDRPTHAADEKPPYLNERDKFLYDGDDT